MDEWGTQRKALHRCLVALVKVHNMDLSEVDNTLIDSITEAAKALAVSLIFDKPSHTIRLVFTDRGDRAFYTGSGGTCLDLTELGAVKKTLPDRADRDQMRESLDQAIKSMDQFAGAVEKWRQINAT